MAFQEISLAIVVILLLIIVFILWILYNYKPPLNKEEKEPVYEHSAGKARSADEQSGATETLLRRRVIAQSESADNRSGADLPPHSSTSKHSSAIVEPPGFISVAEAVENWEMIIQEHGGGINESGEPVTPIEKPVAEELGGVSPGGSRGTVTRSFSMENYKQTMKTEAVIEESATGKKLRYYRSMDIEPGVYQPELVPATTGPNPEEQNQSGTTKNDRLI